MSNTETPARRAQRPINPHLEEARRVLAADEAQREVAGRADPRHEMREEVRDGLRTRRRKRPGDVDKFHIPTEMIPQGMTYEWKRYTTGGMPDPSYDVSLRENGWEPVDASRHPEYMPPGYKGAIVRDGMILMDRPVELTEEARAEDNQNARAMIRAKEQQLGATPQGTLTRDHPTAKPQVRRSYGPVDIPQDVG